MVAKRPRRGSRLMNHFWTTRLGEHEWLMKRAMLPLRVVRVRVRVRV